MIRYSLYIFLAYVILIIAGIALNTLRYYNFKNRIVKWITFIPSTILLFLIFILFVSTIIVHPAILTQPFAGVIVVDMDEGEPSYKRYVSLSCTYTDENDKETELTPGYVYVCNNTDRNLVNLDVAYGDGSLYINGASGWVNAHSFNSIGGSFPDYYFEEAPSSISVMKSQKSERKKVLDFEDEDRNR